jgi:hypothetical protein
MKQLFLLLFAVLLSAGILFPTIAGAQAPNRMSYQAVVRSAQNKLVKNHKVGMRISILYGKLKRPVYVETQMPTTNTNGMVTIRIGAGKKQLGNFTTINWAKGFFYLKTEIDVKGGKSYGITSTSQLLTVPFAFHAETAGSIVGVKKHVALSVYEALIDNDAAFEKGMGGFSGLKLPDSGSPDCTFNFRVPEDYSSGDTIFIKIIGASNRTGDIILSPNFLSIARSGVGYISGEYADSGLTFDKLSITAANIPVETFGYIVAPAKNKQLLPGDAISFGIYRRGRLADDTNRGDFIMHSIEIRY